MAASNTTTREEDDTAAAATEQTPLLPPSPDAEAHTSHPPDGSARTSLLTSLQNPTSNSKGKKRRWPSILALAILCILVICIIVFAFLAPSITESYAQQAAVFAPLELSIDSFTSQGVKARVKGHFSMDASRVEKKSVRDLGRFFTYVANQAETGESEVEVSLPEYGNLVLGTARVPPVWVSIRNGHTTLVDVVTDLRPGDVGGIRKVAEDFLHGRLGQVRVVGKADVPIKSGLISLGKQRLVQEMVFAGKDMPKLPAYKIGKLDVRDVELPGGGTGMMANVSISANNSYPIDFTLPSLGFDILVPGCAEEDSLIKLADAETQETHILPHEEVVLNVTGLVHELSPNLTRNCPVDNSDDKAMSPLDRMVARYLHGSPNTVYVQGSTPQPNPDTPSWLTDLISDIIVPVPLPGKAVQGHLIRNFSLTDTHFALPDPFAEPGTKAGNPRISASVKALVALPEEMRFELNVSRVRADADIYYHGKKLGTLDLRKWQAAQSRRVEGEGKKGKELLLIESAVKDAPVDITDDDVFTDVLQNLLFGGKDVRMQIRALVDVEVGSAIGEFVVKGVEGEGAVVVKPISSPPGRGGNGGVGVPHEFRPKVFGLQILDTSPTSLTLGARVNISNPTNYSASVPFMDIHILANETVIGHATAKGIEIVPGRNDNLYVEAVWDPSTLGGEQGKRVGREFLSQYISGYNTSLTLKAHEGSIPGNPGLGRALGRFGVEMPTPSLGGAPKKKLPGEPDDGDGDGDDDGKKKKGPHFLDDATFHLLTSTATFTLLSPLRQTILYVESINATAFYKGDSVGHIDYDLPFAVPPVGPDGEGVVSPRLPVDWSLGSVGYEAVKGALGERLKLAAYAEVGVRIGEWREGVWFRGGGIGASVRL
ncbi:hypothetical protein LTR56_013744 [Elasticomyces elasticus]|nr:hypothetical protein LTR22_022833 [Elasticomyces elasticus]KAK3637209.1 hypothetical protein LTR56_013744 [Elasticomyces elasticus]KAK4907560.1 hypothetical protein LTR49_023427 [Elasticomyces elasticus]KAK5755297.1 hypothetical protein LTS12_014639 [Elasticomyces elasticus]